MSFIAAFFRTLRRSSALLLVVCLLMAWPHAQGYLEQFLALHNPADPLAAAAQATWLPMGNLLSKLLAAALVAGFGFFFMWHGMKYTHPALPSWAKDDQAGFKVTFSNLPAACKLLYFTVYWFGSLFFFALIFLAASFLA